MNQKEKILSLLKQSEWVSGDAIVKHVGSYRYSARIKDLRDDGYIIEGRKVKGSALWEFKYIGKLVNTPEIPLFAGTQKQLTILNK